jgi:hypothetical protein
MTVARSTRASVCAHRRRPERRAVGANPERRGGGAQAPHDRRCAPRAQLETRAAERLGPTRQSLQLMLRRRQG